MYKIYNKEHELLGYTDELHYIKVRESLGCRSYVSCEDTEAEGIAFKGTAYNVMGVKGADKLEGVETVYVAWEDIDSYIADVEEIASLKANNEQKDEIIEYLNAKITYLANEAGIDLTAVTDEQFEDDITIAAEEARSATEAEGEVEPDDDDEDGGDENVTAPDEGTIEDSGTTPSTNW